MNLDPVVSTFEILAYKLYTGTRLVWDTVWNRKTISQTVNEVYSDLGPTILENSVHQTSLGKFLNSISWFWNLRTISLCLNSQLPKRWDGIMDIISWNSFPIRTSISVLACFRIFLSPLYTLPVGGRCFPEIHIPVWNPNTIFPLPNGSIGGMLNITGEIQERSGGKVITACSGWPLQSLFFEIGFLASVLNLSPFNKIDIENFCPDLFHRRPKTCRHKTKSIFSI